MGRGQYDYVHHARSGVSLTSRVWLCALQEATAFWCSMAITRLLCVVFWCSMVKTMATLYTAEVLVKMRSARRPLMFGSGVRSNHLHTKGVVLPRLLRRGQRGGPGNENVAHFQVFINKPTQTFSFARPEAFTFSDCVSSSPSWSCVKP